MKIFLNVEHSSEFLGNHAHAYNAMFEKIGPSIFTEEYSFLHNDVYQEGIKNGNIDLTDAQKIYWMEILYRAHMSSVASIIRASRWIDSATRDYISGNLYGWAGSCRSLIESAGDTMHSLNSVPLTLSKNYIMIKSIIEGKNTGEKFYSSEELEDILIHFTDASKHKKQDDVPDSHRALQSYKYIEMVDKMGVSGVKDLYSTLCAIVHPAKESVYPLFDDREYLYTLCQEKEKEILKDISSRNIAVMEGVLEAAFNVPIITLKVLQKFSLFKRAKNLRHTNLEHLKLWEKCERYF